MCAACDKCQTLIPEQVLDFSGGIQCWVTKTFALCVYTLIQSKLSLQTTKTYKEADCLVIKIVLIGSVFQQGIVKQYDFKWLCSLKHKDKVLICKTL